MKSNSSLHQFRWRGLALAAALAIAAPVFAQSTAGTNAARPLGYSTWEISEFFGWNWIQVTGNTATSKHQFSDGPTFGGRVTQNFGNHFGLEESFTVGKNNLHLLPNGGDSFAVVRQQEYQLSVSPVIYLASRDSKWRPFFTFGPGGVWFVPQKAITPPNTTTVKLVAPVNSINSKLSPEFAFGAGLKYAASPHFGLRIDLRSYIAENPRFNLPSFPTVPGAVYIAKGGHIAPMEISAGVIFRYGYHAPPAPPAPAPPPPPPPPPAPKANISITGVTGMRDVCPGDNLRLQVNASGWLPDQTPTYQWMVNNQPVAGATAAGFTVPTADGAGNKAITVTVSAPGSTATSNPVNVLVKALVPPTIRFTVNPSTIAYGDKLPLTSTATAGSDCGGAVTTRYTASEGSITGTTYDSSGVSFDMSNRTKQQTKVVRLTATATDAKGQTAAANGNLTITLKPEARRFDDIIFPNANSRVNNCGKRLLLDEVTPLLRADPNAKVVLIGHRDTNERAGSKVDEQRVLNAAAILSAGTGICPQLDLSRILWNSVGDSQSADTRPALCGSSTNVRERSGSAIKESDKRAQYRRVEVWVIPGGADTPASLAGLKAAPEKEVKAKACPR